MYLTLYFLATSNAPHRSRKRRLSSAERDVADDGEPAGKKKVRGESATPSVADADATFLTPLPQIDTKEVKEVTKGVNEVDLEEGSKDLPADGAVIPECIPLPEESAGELDEPPSDAFEDPSNAEEGSKVSYNDATINPVATGRPKASADDDEGKDTKEEATKEGQEDSGKLDK